MSQERNKRLPKEEQHWSKSANNDPRGPPSVVLDKIYYNFRKYTSRVLKR